MAFMTIEEALITAIIPTVVAGDTAIFGLITYREGQKLNRKDLIIPLINEFDSSEDLFLAKALLDDFTCNVPPWDTKSEILKGLFNMSDDDFKYYDRTKLPQFLRIHRDKHGNVYEKVEKITSLKERAVRRSFDSMVYFFFKLQYLYGLGLLSKKDLFYFLLYMILAFPKDKDNDVTGLWKYIDDNDGYGLELRTDFIEMVKTLKREVF